MLLLLLLLLSIFIFSFRLYTTTDSTATAINIRCRYEYLLHEFWVLLRLLNHLLRLSPLLLEDLLRLLDFVLLLSDPYLQLFALLLIRTWCYLIVLVHLINTLVFNLLTILDGFFTDLKHLWMHLVESVCWTLWMDLRHKLIKCIPLKYISISRYFSILLLMI